MIWASLVSITGAGTRRIAPSASLLQRRRDVVSVDLSTAAVRERWAHGMAVDIKYAPLERSLGDPVRTFVMASRVELQAALYGFEQVFIDDRGMGAWIGLGTVDDQSAVDPVFQQME